jgi:hypothetical protein
MFWRKKQVVAPPVETGSAVATSDEAKSTVPKAKEVKAEKLPGPKGIPSLVGKYLIEKKEREPNWVWRLVGVERKSAKGEQAFDIRLFIGTEAVEKRIKVKDYTSLDAHPELIHYEGWYNKESKQVELEEKKVVPKVTIFSQAEIQKKIEELSEPGSTVFFYLTASPASGGPLGRGAALVELNPKYPGPKQKKYNVYAVNVEGTELSSKRMKFFDSDKAKSITSYIKERHYNPYQQG